MDFWFWFFVAATAFVGVCASGWWAYRDGQFGRAWRWVRVLTLGGASTLERDLDYIHCTLCLQGMDAGEKVRTLSCNHVFHRGGISKCEDGIDNWLRTTLTCPSCFETPRPVLPPWMAPPPTPSPASTPPSETPQSSSGLEYTSLPELSSGLDDGDAPLLLPRSETA